MIACDVNEGNARTVVATFTNSIEVATKEVDATNLEALLNNLRSKLVHAVFRSVSDDMINCSAPISWGSMFANVLDAPVAELAVRDDIDTSKDLIDAGTLLSVRKIRYKYAKQ